MREALAENISRLHLLAYLAFDPDGQEAQTLDERERRMRTFHARHCLDHWDMEEALRNIRDCFLDNADVDGPIRRTLKKKKSTRLPFNHCDDVIEALRYLYLLDEDDQTSVKKEFENKFLWHFFVLPVIEAIRATEMLDVGQPEINMVVVDAILEEIRTIIVEDETEGSYEDAMVARGVMMANMK